MNLIVYTAKFEAFFKSNFKKLVRVLIHQISLMKNIKSKFLKLIKYNQQMNAHEMFLQQALNLVRLHLTESVLTSKSTNN